MKLYIVGFGCGSRDGMTIEAEKAIQKSDLIVGYTVYAELMREYFPEKEFFTTAMRQEKERVEFGKGPFSIEENIKHIKACSADVLLTKESGKAGGYYEKAEAAKGSELSISDFCP